MDLTRRTFGKALAALAAAPIIAKLMPKAQAAAPDTLPPNGTIIRAEPKSIEHITPESEKSHRFYYTGGDFNGTPATESIQVGDVLIQRGKASVHLSVATSGHLNNPAHVVTNVPTGSEMGGWIEAWPIDSIVGYVVERRAHMFDEVGQ